MIPKHISGATIILGPPKDWKPEDGHGGRLPVRTQGVLETGRVWCDTAWEPTRRELDMLIRGGSIVLRVWGFQPPVALFVEPAPAIVETHQEAGK